MQFLWRDIILVYDLVGFYFLIESFIVLSIFIEFVMFCLKVFIFFGFKVVIIFCDGVLFNLIVLKMLIGYGRIQFLVNEVVDSLYDKFFLDVFFFNLEDFIGRFIFVMIWFSYQVVEIIF